MGRKLQQSALPNPPRVCDAPATDRCRGISAKRDGIRSAKAAWAEVTLYRAIQRRRFVRQMTCLPANPCGPGRIAHRLKALSSGESGAPGRHRRDYLLSTRDRSSHGGPNHDESTGPDCRRQADHGRYCVDVICRPVVPTGLAVKRCVQVPHRRSHRSTSPSALPVART